MTGHLATVARSRLFRCCLVFLVGVAWAGIATAQTLPTVVRVEEEWELVVATPDPNSDAPQITCVMSPVGNAASFHAAFEINYQSLPSFTPGGLQLQVWNGEWPVSQRKFPNESVLATAGETICWTQSLEIVEGNLVMEIIDGSSTTWGSFGGQGYLKATVNTTLADINAYDPAVSIAHSGVSYAANRVQSLVLKSVRLTTSTGEVLVQDDYPRTVH